jgi:phospholipid/cholesterol/gamma-HCH transport system permease protein
MMLENDDRIAWESEGRTLKVRLPARLGVAMVAEAWEPLTREASRAESVIVDAAKMEECDGSGLALVREIGTAPRGHVHGLSEDFSALIGSMRGDEEDAPAEKSDDGRGEPSLAQLGRAAAAFGSDLREMIAFLGQCTATLGVCFLHPRLVRWGDFWLTVERAGLSALPIVATISFLTGMILAFQAAAALQQFGVEIFVVNLVSLAMLREMGVIMTSVVLAGRSGSAFAAEIGTMKINEEIDALQTMGLEPVRFLVVPRLLAGIFVMPVLTLFSGAVGIAGGFFVMRLEGFPFSALWQQLVSSVGANDLLVGFIKSFFFGLLVAGIGCLRGLQTRPGASSVGISTTRAVVSGIFLIVAADAIFAAIFYVLDF